MISTVHPGDLSIPLTWNQRVRLRREVECGELLVRAPLVVLLPDGSDIGDALTRVSKLTQQEDVLRLVDLSLRDNSAVVAAQVSLPVETAHVDSASDLETVAGGLSRIVEPLAGSPLWEATVVEFPHEGRRQVAICAAFDHLITDGRSHEILRARLLNPELPPGKPFREWAILHNELYPPRPTVEASPIREFWRSYLEQTPMERLMDRSSLCPDPEATMSGTIDVVTRVLPLTVPALRRATAERRCTAFTIFLASTSCALARSAGVTVYTFRVATHARTVPFMDTVGFFASAIPIRVEDPNLGDFETAMQTSRSSFLRTLEYQTTPWSYIASVASPEDAVWRGCELLPTVDLNYVIDSSPQGMKHLYEDRETSRQGRVGALRLTLTLVGQERLCVTGEFDRARFSPAGVRELIDEIAEVSLRAIP